VLSDVEIKASLHDHILEIDPFVDNNLQAASYDLTVGRVLGGDAKEEEGGTMNERGTQRHSEAYYEIPPGGSVAILTWEKLVLGAEIAGHVNLQNHMAIRGLELLNPGHIDPGWGHNTKGKSVGFELTAIIRNISNRPQKLLPKETFLTIVFYRLGVPTTNPYVPEEWFEDPIKRAADLDAKAQRIRAFVEFQKEILDQLEDKLSYKDVLASLGLLTATLGLVITFVVAFVVTSSAPTQVNINGFLVDRSVLLFGLGFLLAVIIIVVSVRRKKRDI
jgi:deoxycytidine triphosphate deaminase